MCDCIKTTSEAVLNHITDSCAKKGETVLPIKTYDGDGLQNTVFTMGGNGAINDYVLKTDFVYKTTFIKKDKTVSNPKANHIQLIFSYCPFCGEPYNKSKPTDTTDVQGSDTTDGDSSTKLST
jgi:hypothetical protein